MNTVPHRLLLLLLATAPALAAPQQQTASGASYTLEQLETIAEQHNPTLGEARAAVEAARGRVRQAGLWPNPRIGYLGTEIRGGSFAGGQHGVFLEQPILLGGKLHAAQQVLEQQAAARQAELERQQLRVRGGLRLAFYVALAAQQRVALWQDLVRLTTDALETTRQLFNVGQADQADVLSAQVELDRARMSLLAAQQQQAATWTALATAVGKPDLPAGILQGDLEALPALDPAQVLARIEQQSPALRLAQSELAAAEASVHLARSRRMPDLSLRVGFQQDRELLTAAGASTGGIGFAELSLTLPVFNRQQGELAAASADRQQAQQELLRTRLELRRRAAQLLADYQSARAALDRLRTQTIPLARQAYQLYLTRYEQGAASYPQVLVSQRSYLELRLEYIDLLENAWKAALTLDSLLDADPLARPQSALAAGGPTGLAATTP
jgi:cobalt-zinc-cadmium efflux system outer membrane protein